MMILLAARVGHAFAVCTHLPPCVRKTFSSMRFLAFVGDPPRAAAREADHARDERANVMTMRSVVSKTC